MTRIQIVLIIEMRSFQLRVLLGLKSTKTFYTTVHLKLSGKASMTVHKVRSIKIWFHVCDMKENV